MDISNKNSKPVLTRTVTKMLVIYLAIILVSISLISVILYFRFSAATIGDIQKNIQNELAQNMNQLRLVREQENAIGLQLINDSDVMNVIYRGTTSELSRYKASSKLSQVVESNPMISSIYAYNSKTGQFVSNFGPSSPESLEAEMRALPGRLASGESMKFIPIRYTHMSTSGDIAAADVITSVFTESVQPVSGSMQEGGGPLESSVIINLKADYVENILTVPDNSANSGISLLSAGGVVVCGSGLADFGNSLKSVDYVGTILDANETSGYMLENENGRQFLVTYCRSAGMPLTIVSKSDYSGLLSKLHDLQRTIICVCLAIFALCAVISALALYNVYLPFGAFISGVISRSNEQGVFIEQSMPILKETFLKNLLEGVINTQYNIPGRIRELKLNIAQGRARVILFSIDGSVKAAGVPGVSACGGFMAALQGILADEMPRGSKMEAADTGAGSFAVLINADREEACGAAEMEWLHAIGARCARELGFSVTAAVGMAVDGLEDIHLSFSNCGELLKYRFVYGYGSVIDNALVNSSINAKYTSTDENKKKIIQSIKACDTRLMEKEMSDVFQLISASRYDYIRLTVNQLALDIMKAVEPLVAPGGEGMDFFNTYGSLNAIDTLGEVKEWFVSYGKGVICRLEGRNDSRKKDVIDIALAFIDANYLNPDISAGMISDVVNLTYGYFGKLFGEQVGMSVNEYITGLRMKKAREMLEINSIPVNSISTKVGFSNQSYFAAIFKKYYGYKPNQYRLNCKKGMEHAGLQAGSLQNSFQGSGF